MAYRYMLEKKRITQKTDCRNATQNSHLILDIKT